MNNSNLEKPVKSTIWIVATILANIIIVLLIFAFASILLRGLFLQLFGLVVAGILIWLIGVAAIIYAIRLGVKSVLKKNLIKKEQIFKISLGVALIPFLTLTGISISVVLQKLPELTDVIGFLRLFGFVFGVSLAYFGVTYYWCKKLIK